MLFSKTSSTSQKADSDWPKVLHPAQTTDHSCATGSSSCSFFTDQDHHPPAPADHCAACGQTCSSHHPTSAPCRSELTLQHIRLASFHHSSALHIGLMRWKHLQAVSLLNSNNLMSNRLEMVENGYNNEFVWCSWINKNAVLGLASRWWFNLSWSSNFTLLYFILK